MGRVLDATFAPPLHEPPPGARRGALDATVVARGAARFGSFLVVPCGRAVVPLRALPCCVVVREAFADVVARALPPGVPDARVAAGGGGALR